VLLVSAPYALKAGDAETVGGLPASAFMLAAPASSGGPPPTTDSAATSTSGAATPLTSSDVTTTGGIVNAIPFFSTATNIQNSILTQTGATALNVGGKLNLPAAAAATKTAGADSRPLDLVASSFSSTSGKAVNQTFQWQAEPAANNTASPSGTLNLLFGAGGAKPAETGLNIGANGVIKFATGQTFPGSGTVTSVASGTGLTGGPITESGTLSINSTVVPLLSSVNNFTASQNVSGSLTATYLSASSIAANTVAVSGVNSATTGTSNGVFGSSASASGYGVYGQSSNNVGVYGFASSTSGSPTYGVHGAVSAPSFFYSSAGVSGQNGGGLGNGVYGQYSTLSAIGDGYNGYSGVWGDGGPSDTAIKGTVDDGIAGAFLNNSDTFATLFLSNLGTGGTGLVLQAYGGNTGKGCVINTSGALNCDGPVSALVSTESGTRKVGLSAIESPQNWFEDFGSARLETGSALVALDSNFIQTVNSGMEYHVFLTPNGDCNGLYISQKTATSFEVRELRSGTSSVGFDYRIVALRKDYENIRFADHTSDADPRKQMLKYTHANSHAEPGTGPKARVVPILKR
jgi:hypothetical protein